MAVGVLFDFPGVTQAQYDAMLARMTGGKGVEPAHCRRPSFPLSPSVNRAAATRKPLSPREVYVTGRRSGVRCIFSIGCATVYSARM
jgi:hypothetical protein